MNDDVGVVIIIKYNSPAQIFLSIFSNYGIINNVQSEF
jgi:hypothetical protein